MEEKEKTPKTDRQTDPNQAQIRKAARTYLHRDGGDLPALAGALRDLGAFNAREVKLLIDAVKADVLQDLETPPAEAIRGLVRERLASRVLSESDATYEEAKWAVETWAEAFGNGKTLSHLPTTSSSLSWEESGEPEPNLADLRAGAPPATAGNAVPQPKPAQPRFVPQPVPLRATEPISTVYAEPELVAQPSWARWIVIAAIVFLLTVGMLVAIALPSFVRARDHARAQAAYRIVHPDP